MLRTKLFIPPLRPNLVPRPHLIEKLNRGLRLGHKLTLVSAPAGFGKTTLLGEWIASEGGPKRVAWLSLDGEDNDPSLFWSYVKLALQAVVPSLGEDLLNLATPVPDLVNAIIAAGPEPFTLILDDFHAITTQQINDDVARLLDNLPPQMHVILCGRADPPWNLARQRGRREMMELRAEELRFSLQEVGTFLNDIMGLALPAESIANLDTRTEGWIAGLQLAAISMQGRDASAFIQDLSGSHRYIMDYLVEEVLEQQPADVRAFLLQTSILERLSARLCDTALARSDSQMMLSRLERSNLFLIGLDDRRCWYRYHPLFSDLLRSRLDMVPEDQLVQIHRRASDWYQRNGLLTKAVTHSLAAGDIQRAARLVEGHAMAFVQHGELKSLIRRLEALTDEVLCAHPWLCIAYAWLLAYAGRAEGIERLLQLAEVGLDEVKDLAQARLIQGRIALLRGYMADLERDATRALRFGRQALDQIGDDNLSISAYAWSEVGISLRKTGHLSSAAEAFSKAVELSQKAGNSHVAVMVLCRSATVQIWRGQLRQAMATCREALCVSQQYTSRGGHTLPTAAYAHIQMSRVHYERNDLNIAYHHARQGIALCQRWGQADIHEFGRYHLARILYRRRDLEGLLRLSQEHQRATRTLSTLYSASAAELEIMYRLASGDLDGAYRHAQELGMGLSEDLPLDQYHHLFTYVSLLNAMSKLDESLHLLSRMLNIAEETGAWGYAIELWAMQAVALEMKGERNQALATLAHALSLARSEGYVSAIITAGAPMGELLLAAAKRGTHAEYALELLAAFNAELPGAGAAAPPLSLSSPPVDALTEREVQVLRLLTRDLSTAEIAAELVISISTLRTHTKRIYGKLGVHSRLQAVARAHELGYG